MNSNEPGKDDINSDYTIFYKNYKNNEAQNRPSFLKEPLNFGRGSVSLMFRRFEPPCS